MTELMWSGGVAGRTGCPWWCVVASGGKDDCAGVDAVEWEREAAAGRGKLS